MERVGRHGIVGEFDIEHEELPTWVTLYFGEVLLQGHGQNTEGQISASGRFSYATRRVLACRAVVDGEGSRHPVFAILSWLHIDRLAGGCMVEPDPPQGQGCRNLRSHNWCNMV